ncbi:MAG: AraC family transcriptional regulator [Hymenobacter sp.]|nr:MAG: AraC family transcriptional regulator [Hymenobacter sp.]
MQKPDITFVHPVSNQKFLIYKLENCPDTYLRSADRPEFFEIIWFSQPDLTGPDVIEPDLPSHQAYLIPPFRSLEVPIKDKEGYLIAFKREYLEEDDKEFALDVFNLFNQQGQFTLMPVERQTQCNLEHLRILMCYECENPLGTFLALKALLKVFLLHLIRQSQKGFLEQDVNQKRVYDFCVLLDGYYMEERKAAFYADKLGISEKRLNQVLLEKMKKTVTQLIHARLILEAKRKITAGELTIKEIAYLLNFKEHSYFGRFFKQQTGFSPENYKKQISRLEQIQE